MPGGVRQQLGSYGEDLACAELRRQGLRIVARNWRCAVGEIDVVAAEESAAGLTLVFCEVKCRRGLRFGYPLEAVTYAKLRTLRQLAAIWLRQHRVAAAAVRLDAVGVLLLPGEPPRIDHLKAVG